MKKYFKLQVIKKSLMVFMAACILLITNFNVNAQLNISLSVRIAPPALPVYDQPLCPGDGYLWVPGYWAYANNDYYWVPGTWVLPPQMGLYWTPGYWGFSNGYYGWHTGYWGSHIGFYGGINYGFGYVGVGYSGGLWSGSTFRYNTAVTHVNTTVVHNTYVDKTVIVKNTTVNNNYSFNGQGGVKAKPTPQEQRALKEPHIEATSEQTAHEKSARSDPDQFAAANHGHPKKLAVAKPDNSEQKNDDQKNTATAKDESPENKQDNKVKKDDDQQNSSKMANNDQMKIHQDHKSGKTDNRGKEKKPE